MKPLILFLLLLLPVAIHAQSRPTAGRIMGDAGVPGDTNGSGPGLCNGSSTLSDIYIRTDVNPRTVYVCDSNGAWDLFTSGGGTPGGADTQVQFNDAGVFGADGNFTYNSGTGTVTAFNYTVDALGTINFDTRAKITSPADSVLLLRNNAAADFNMLKFGGTTSSFPALKRTTTSLGVRLADDTGDAPFSASNGTFSGTLSTGDGTVAGQVKMFELTANGSNFRAWLAPDTLTADVTFRFPNTSPTAGQVMLFGAPSGGISDITFGAAGGTPGGSDTQIQRNNAGVFGAVTGCTSAGTNITCTSANLIATRPRFITSIDDTNGNEVFGITATGSAVNELTIANAAASGEPSISATGSDTDIDITLVPKGAGTVTVGSGTADVGIARASAGLLEVNSGTAGTLRDITTRNTNAATYTTTTNCSDSAGDAACSAAPAGSVVIDAADTNTVVSTTAVTANSQIFIQEDSSLGTRLSVTCNTTIARSYVVTARTAATSFTITASAAPVTNPACLSFKIIN